MNNLEKGSIKIDNFICCSFITADTPYELILAQYLLPSLEKLGLPHYIEVVENEGSWLKNVAKKPQCIGNCMEKFPGKDIVFLDADAEVLKFPQLFTEIPEEYDIALHILDWDKWYNNNSHIKEVLSGTLFIRNNERTKSLVEEWYRLANFSDMWEQKVLEQILRERKNITIYELPLSYCYIKTLPNGKSPLIHIEEPIIVHNQCSRELRRTIK